MYFNKCSTKNQTNILTRVYLMILYFKIIFLNNRYTIYYITKI